THVRGSPSTWPSVVETTPGLKYFTPYFNRKMARSRAMTSILTAPAGSVGSSCGFAGYPTVKICRSCPAFCTLASSGIGGGTFPAAVLASTSSAAIFDLAQWTERAVIGSFPDAEKDLRRTAL